MCDSCGCGDEHQHEHHEHKHTRRIAVEADLLGENARFAAQVRKRLSAQGILGLNLVSSPGSGKTTLLVKTIEALAGEAVAVIEGDQQTSRDADRIKATGAPALQINTGKGCHLDAHGILHALDHLQPPDEAILFIENVGNLVCPALFDLGEAHKVVVISVAEGDDKPLKYPHMFAAAHLMLINKIDLLPYVDFDMASCVEAARRVNPRLEVLEVSAKTGAGVEAFVGWLKRERAIAAALR